MTSLKAIFISRRKTNLLILMSLILLLPLKAGEFRVAFVGNNESYNMIAEDVLDLLSGSVDSELGKSLYLERINRENLDKYQKSVSSILDSESFEKLEKTKQAEASAEDLTLKVIYPSFSEEEISWLYSGDAEAARFLREREGLDILAVFSVQSSVPVDTISIYLNGEKVRDALYAESLKEVETEAMIDLFFPYIKDKSTKLLAIELPERSTLYIDGKQTPLYTGYAALKDGPHTLSYTAMGYLPKTVEIVVSDAFPVVDLALEEVIPLPIYYSTLPYGAEVTFNGVIINTALIEDGRYPYTVTATLDGFDVYSMQSTKRVDILELELKPEWIASSNMLSEAKGEFYKALFITLMSFGASIGMETVAGLYPERNLEPLSVVLGGVSLVSLINVIDSGFEYFQAAKLGL